MNIRVSGVILENNAILLVRHDYGKEQLWHIPGGSVNEYETLIAALKREFLEELDLVVKPDQLWLVCDSIRPDGVHVLHCIFITKRLQGEPIIQKSETSGVEFAWIPIIDLLSLHMYPNIATHVEQLAATYPRIPGAKYVGRCQSASSRWEDLSDIT